MKINVIIRNWQQISYAIENKCNPMANRNKTRKHFISILDVLDNGIRQEIIISSISNNNTDIYIVPSSVLSSYVRSENWAQRS